MTTKPSITTTQPDNYVRLPDAPKPEDMNNFKYLHLPGNTHHLAEHLGNPDTTIVSGEAYISREPTGEQRGLMAPDLLIAFKVNPEANVNRNGYVISEQGKPPDFVLEIASASTGRRDATSKREGYAGLGIPEYWRFDHSGGQHHGAPLAGDRLEGGSYQPIPVERIDEQTFQGYSAVLNLYLRWEQGRLGWYDPATGQHIVRFSDERGRANAAQDRAEVERERADAAEARVRELEAELRRRETS